MEHWKLAHTVLLICFIILITAVNVYLIVTTVRKRGFSYRPRSLIIISLAVGDIVLALFSLFLNVTHALEFDSFIPVSCKTNMASTVYSIFLIHFVYGVGLITLAMEMLIRHRRRSAPVKTCNSFVRGIVVSAVPWLTGLAVVLPLTMVGSEYGDSHLGGRFCSIDFIFPTSGHTLSRIQAMYSVSVLLPACLAVVVCIAVMCVRLTPALYLADFDAYQDVTPGVVIDTYTTTNIQQQYPLNTIPSNQPFQTFQGSTEYNQQDRYCPISTSGKLNLPESQYTPPTAQYPTQQYAPLSDVIVSDSGTYPVVSQNATVTVTSDTTREKILLLAVCIVYFTCAVPYSAVKLHDVSPMNVGSETFLITTLLLYWLSVFRSLVTPVIWIRCSRNML